MRHRSRRDLHARTRPADFGLDTLEARRMLDGCGAPDPLTCGCGGGEAEYIEVTRLDGGESFWVRADDPEYGIVEPCDEPGEDADLYSFDSAAAALAVAPLEGDEPGDDNDLYDFGQDRGETIDDDADYEFGDEAVPVSVPTPGPLVGAPTEVPVVASEPVQHGEPMLAVEPAVIALAPQASKITWLGDESDALSLFTLAPGPAAGERLIEPVVPAAPDASWIDIVALPM